MQEVIEQILDYLKGIWIKRRFLMIATWLICPIGWYFVAQLPNVYESNARVYVDTQSLLRPLLRGLTVETNPDTQIRLMVKTLMSRPNIERISRMTDLDINANNAKEYDKIIDKIKNGLRISTAGRENIYTLSYQSEDAAIAKNVVQSALTVFMENTLGENRTDSDDAQQFLDAQIKEYEKRLLESESRLTDFQQKYSGVLPNQSNGYFGLLASEKEKLKTIELELLETSTQLDSAKQQLKSSSGSSSKTENSIKTNSSIQTTYDSRITELEATLDGLLLRYTDMHPDVKETTRRLAYLKEQRTKEIEEYIQSTNNKDSGIVLSSNPVVQEVQIQVNQLENLVASLGIRKINQQDKVADLEQKIHTLPEIEAERTALNRGYSITKSKYEQLLNRKETAMLAQQADQTTDSIQFRIIDPPREADEPVGPLRLLYLIIVLVVGLGAGVGLSLLMSQINPVVTSSSQVSKATGIPVFGSIAATENLGLQQWHKRKTRLFILSNTLLFIVFSCFIAYALFSEQVLMPLLRGML